MEAPHEYDFAKMSDEQLAEVVNCLFEKHLALPVGLKNPFDNPFNFDREWEDQNSYTVLHKQAVEEQERRKRIKR